MSLPNFAIESDADLVTAVRAKTSYADTAGGLPGDETAGQMKETIDDAKRVLYTRTGSSDWYSDVAYGQALIALSALKAKARVENVNIDSYGIGDESLSFRNADPDDSQQIRAWSDEVNESLDQSDVEFDKKQDLSLRNTSSYIG